MTTLLLKINLFDAIINMNYIPILLMNSLIQLCITYCYSTRIALASNNPKGLICY